MSEERLAPGWPPSYWPVLVAPVFAVLAAFIGPRFEGFDMIHVRLESFAPLLPAAAALAYAARLVVTRQRLQLLLMCLAIAFTLREIHWRWTHSGVYVMAGAIAVWAGLWWRHLWPRLRQDRVQGVWILAAAMAYFVSLLISRRAFRGIAGEQEIHLTMEELTETVAHCMLIFSGLVGNWRRGLADQQQAPAP